MKTIAKKTLLLTLLLLVLVACDKERNNKLIQEDVIETLSPTGVKTILVDKAKFENISYVNVLSEAVLENGTKVAPYKSILKAVENAKAGIKTAIIVAGGEYAEGTIELKEGTTLLGGFNKNDWTRDVLKNETVLLGIDQQRILKAYNNTIIDGFVFSGSVYRGTGSAIYCNGTSPMISNNTFTGNLVLGPLNWNPKFWHETANNGGAIYGDNGASPTIKNNVFVNNRTENGRGAAIAFDNKCDVKISDNVFVNNISGTKDPMRSSDGGAISIFNRCKAEISNNIFLGNKALSKNDGGAVFVALWSSANIKNNILVASESGDDAGALFVGGQEHRYGGAQLDPIPSKDQFYVTIDNNQFYGNENSSKNSGAMRFTMESRGEFTNNILAYNNGVYFQRSEVAVKNNIIFDNFLFIETKEGLKQGSIENNVIWGDFELTTPAKVMDNRIRDGFSGGTNNTMEAPKIKNDWRNYNVVSTTKSKNSALTHFLVSDANYAKNELVNKVVRAGNKWGIVQSNTENDMTIWGNLFGAETIQLLPTYTVIK
tara:strand:+ start:28406 stop:30034 length:1629 start_codon:yes stop_codon:yes gene_type:complete